MKMDEVDGVCLVSNLDAGAVSAVVRETQSVGVHKFLSSWYVPIVLSLLAWGKLLPALLTTDKNGAWLLRVHALT